MTLAEDLENQFRAGLRDRHIAEFIDNEELDGGELSLELEQPPLLTRFHQLMNEAGCGEEGDREAALTRREAKRQARMRLAGARVSESDDVLAGDDIFAAREFESERLVERWNGGKVERVKTFHRGKTGGADAPLDHPPFAIDEFELGEAQKIAGMIEPLAGGFLGNFVIFAQESRQFELPQMMREQHLGRRRAGGWSRGRHAPLPDMRAI